MTSKGFTTEGGIRFEPVRNDPGEYEASKGGIRFSICKSTNAGFGVSAYLDGKGIANRLGGIAWMGSRKRCAEHADRLLKSHGGADVQRYEIGLPATITVIIEARDEREAIRKAKDFQGRTVRGRKFPALVGDLEADIEVGKFAVGSDNMVKLP